MIEHKQMLEDILEMNRKYVVISGTGDIIFLHGTPIFKNFTKDSYFVILGNHSNDDMIIEAMTVDGADHVDKEGEYSFDAILKYIPAEYDEYGCTMRDYLEIAYIELKFNQTFLQRERELKLGEVLQKDMDDLFKF